MNTLEGLSANAIRRLARVIAGHPVEVELSSRFRAPATLLTATPTFLLDPTLCGLFDVFVLAELSRRARDHSPETWETWAEAVTPAARRSVLRDFPGTRRFAGLYRAEGTPEVQPRGRELKPIVAADLRRGSGALGASWGVDVLGAENDYGALFGALPGLATENYPELPGVPVARLPLDFSGVAPSEASRAWTERKRRTFDESAASAARCIQRKNEGPITPTGRPRPRSFGNRLDARQLAHLPVARRTGEPLPLFRDRPRHVRGAFEPKKMLTVLAVDVCKTEDRLRPSHQALCLVSYFATRMLDSPLAILLFDDRCRAADGYLHVSGVIKEPDEPFGPRVEARIYSALEGREPPRDSASCVSLQARTITRHIDRWWDGRYESLGVYSAGAAHLLPGLDVEVDEVARWTKKSLDASRAYPKLAQSIGGIASRELGRALERQGLQYHVL